MTKPILSICIPNYNRPEFLLRNLESIARQRCQGIEIVVCDDNSSEDIQSVIDKFRKKYPTVKLNYKQNSKNLGFDKNVLKSINLANGEYCWLLSNDDQILSGSINRIINIVKKKTNPALILVNYQRYDELLKKITSKRMIALDKDIVFKDPSQFFFYKTPDSYFNHLGLNCLTMSVNIFKRKHWQEAVKDNNQYVKYNFIHLFILASTIKKHPNIYYISKPQLQYTANNHRIWSNPIWHDIRHYFLDHLLDIGYSESRTLVLRKKLKKSEIDEKLSLLAKKYPKIHNFLALFFKKSSHFFYHNV